MASSTDAEKLAYVMVILKNTEMPKPDYAAAAVEAGINNANNAQKKFRSIVKSTGFDLVEGKVVGTDGNGATPVGPAATPKRSRAKKADGETPKKTPARKATNGTPSKKRKLDQPLGDAADQGEENTELVDAAAVKEAEYETS